MLFVGKNEVILSPRCVWCGYSRVFGQFFREEKVFGERLWAESLVERTVLPWIVGSTCGLQRMGDGAGGRTGGSTMD